MAIFKNYVPNIHNIYNYVAPPTRVPLVYAYPTGYNTSCQGAAIDYSGVSVLGQGFARQLNIPSNIGQQDLCDNVYNIDDINYWNSVNHRVVLISPKHAIVCEHYRFYSLPSPNESYTFLGKSGTSYQRNVIGSVSLGYDMELLELDTILPDDVKIYNRIANIKTMLPLKEIWVHENQARAYKLQFIVPLPNPTGEIVSYYQLPVIDEYNTNPCGNSSPYVWSGDSGSPTFTLDNEGNTCFIGLKNAFVEWITDAVFSQINDIIITGGYSLTYVTVNPAPPAVCSSSIIREYLKNETITSISISAEPNKKYKTSVSYAPIGVSIGEEAKWLKILYYDNEWQNPKEVVNVGYYNHGFVDLINAYYKEGLTLIPLDYNSKTHNIEIKINNELPLLLFENNKTIQASNLNTNFDIIRYSILNICKNM